MQQCWEVGPNESWMKCRDPGYLFMSLWRVWASYESRLDMRSMCLLAQHLSHVSSTVDDTAWRPQQIPASCSWNSQGLDYCAKWIPALMKLPGLRYFSSLKQPLRHKSTIAILSIWHFFPRGEMGKRTDLKLGKQPFKTNVQSSSSVVLCVHHCRHCGRF